MGDPKTCGWSQEFDGVIICRLASRFCEPNDCHKEKSEAMAKLFKRLAEMREESDG